MYYRRLPHVACRKVVSETVALDLRGRVVVGLNDAGAWVFDNLRTPRTAEELADAMQVDAADAVHLQAFLESLRDAGLVEPATRDEGATAALSEWTAVELPAVVWQERMETVMHASPSQGPDDGAACGF